MLLAADWTGSLNVIRGLPRDMHSEALSLSLFFLMCDKSAMQRQGWSDDNVDDSGALQLSYLSSLHPRFASSCITQTIYTDIRILHCSEPDPHWYFGTDLIPAV